jgi:transcriptional regulator with XRE-family HTH domain
MRDRAHTAVTDRDIILLRFGRRVRELRTARSWSQRDLGERCGLDRMYLSGVERGCRNVGLVNIGRIAKALGTVPSDLLCDL